MKTIRRSVILSLLAVPLVAPGGSSIGIGSVRGICSGFLEGALQPQSFALTLGSSGVQFQFREPLPEIVTEPAPGTPGDPSAPTPAPRSVDLPQACAFEYPHVENGEEVPSQGQCFFGQLHDSPERTPVRGVYEVDIRSPDSTGAEISWVQDLGEGPSMLGIQMLFAPDYRSLEVSLEVGTENSVGSLSGQLGCDVQIRPRATQDP